MKKYIKKILISFVEMLMKVQYKNKGKKFNNKKLDNNKTLIRRKNYNKSQYLIITNRNLSNKTKNF